MTAPIDRLTMSLADRYRLERELGAGGMATAAGRFCASGAACQARASGRSAAIANASK